MTDKIARRDVTRGIGVLLVSGALAGCSDSNGGGSDGGSGTPTDGGGSGGSVPAEADEYLQDAKLYDGTLVDETGSSSVDIDVGGGSSGLAFDPPALKVSTGTTVTWTWTGQGGGHNVVAKDESFKSGSAEAGEGVTFEHTFEDTGVFNYYCSPHKAIGMKGSVIVE